MREVLGQGRFLSEGALRGLLTLVRGLTLADSLDLLEEVWPATLMDKVYDDSHDAAGQPFVDYCVRTGLQSACVRTGYIWFHGGPPKNRGWMAGSVAQFTADRLLWAVHRQGKGVVAKVLRNHFLVGAP
jgi:hypothetical protein